MLSAWARFAQPEKNSLKVQLAVGGCAVAYGIYKAIKSRNYLQNGQDNAFPHDTRKMKDVSTIIGPMIFIDNINTIRINVVGSIIFWFAAKSARKGERQSNTLYQYLQDYSILTPLWASVLNLAFNIGCQYKTRPDIAMSWASVKRICSSSAYHSLADLIAIPFFSWVAIKAFRNAYITPFIIPYLFVFNSFIVLWFNNVSSPLPGRLNDWIWYTFCPYGCFISFANHLSQVVFGYKLKWRFFGDESQGKRYKKLQKAMECFEFKFSSVLTIDQETIDNKYNEINANTRIDRKQLEHSYYMLSSFASYWQVRKYGAVNLWMYSLCA